MLENPKKTHARVARVGFLGKNGGMRPKNKGFALVFRPSISLKPGLRPGFRLSRMIFQGEALKYHAPEPQPFGLGRLRKSLCRASPCTTPEP